MFKGLMKKVPAVFHRGQSNLDRRVVLTAFEDAWKQFLELEKEIKHYDHGREQAGHTEPSREGSAYPADRSDPEDIPKRRQAGDRGIPRVQRQSRYEDISPDVREAFTAAKGNAVRVKEILEEKGHKVPYSTLTRIVRGPRTSGGSS